MPSIVRWQELLRRVRTSEGTAEPPPSARVILTTFKTTGRRPPFGWLPCGLDHEDPAWPDSFGPRLPTEVDWAGF